MSKRRRAASSSASDVGPPIVLRNETCTLWRRHAEHRAESRFIDVVVHVGGSEFEAHRVVLAAASDYFDKLFSSGMREATQRSVSVHEVPPDAFAALLSFVYVGHCEVEEDRLLVLLEAASRLQVATLQDAIVAALKARLSTETALSLWASADRMALTELAEAAMGMALNSFDLIASSDALLEANRDQLRTLLSSDKLRVKDETVTFNALVHWVGKQPTPPDEATILDLARHVRFACMPVTFVQKTVRPWPPLRGAAGQTLLLEAMMSLLTGSPKPTPRPGGRIEWVARTPNMVVTTAADGSPCFHNTRECGISTRETVTGKHLITSGRHSWVVSMNGAEASGTTFGVCGEDCDFSARPGGTSVAGISLKDASRLLCHRFCSLPPLQPMQHAGSITAGTKFRALLDMDARTLSFEIDGDNRGAAYTHLPPAVYPYVATRHPVVIAVHNE